MHDEETDEAVIAEAIADPNRPNRMMTIAGECLDVAFFPPNGGEVELIGSEREL